MKTKFFTGVGDAGKVKIGKMEISKADFLFEVLGNLDELNSWLGFCKMAAGKTYIRLRNFRKDSIEIFPILKEIQEALFIAQAEIAAIGLGVKNNNKKITPAKTEFLEKIIGEIDTFLSPLKNFVIPGGSELSSRLDIARAISRRVEKTTVRYSKEKELSPELLKFLNRLSSALFALARYANFKLGIKEENPSYN